MEVSSESTRLGLGSSLSRIEIPAESFRPVSSVCLLCRLLFVVSPVGSRFAVFNIYREIPKGSQFECPGLCPLRVLRHVFTDTSLLTLCVTRYSLLVTHKSSCRIHTFSVFPADPST